MRVVCVYTEEIPKSREKSKRTISTGKDFGIDVELYPSVYYKNVVSVCESLNLKMRYQPKFKGIKTNFVERFAPATRIANGITHYMLYKWSVENNEPITILEHDSIFVGHLPKPIEDGIIQVSSHKDFQMTPKTMSMCSRAQKMKKYEPKRKPVMDWPEEGIMKHPLSGTNGTCGYIVGPKAAMKMVEYIEESGVGFADRVRDEHIGEGNLHLQVPQSVFCLSDIRTSGMMKP